MQPDGILRRLRLALIGVIGATLLAITALHYVGSGASALPVGDVTPPPPAATTAHDGPALVAQLEARPLRVPVAEVQPDFRCPAAPVRSGPVALETPARSPGGVSVLVFRVADSYAGAIVVRGERLDGGAGMSFQTPDGMDYAPLAVLHVPVHRGDGEATVAALSDAGCWAIVLDGYRFSEVFLVNLK